MSTVEGRWILQRGKNTSEGIRGERLRQLRKKYGMSQVVVEAEADLGSGYLQRLECGKVKQPLRETLERILAVLGARYNECREVLESYGYYVSTPLPNDAEIVWACQVSQQFLDSVPFPGYLLDCGQRLLAWNMFFLKAVGMQPGSAVSTRLRGLSILSMIFDEQYQVVGLTQNPDMFFPPMARIFQRELRPYSHEEWCQELIADALETLPLFRKYWTGMQHDDLQELAARAVVPLHVSLPGGTVLQFRLAVEYFLRDSRFRVVYFIPSDMVTFQQCEVWAAEEG
jgi:transcriptional regulator with XRE-family HTH domain